MTDFVPARTARVAACVFVLLLQVVACTPNEKSSAVAVPELARARVVEPRLTSATAWAPCRKTRVKNRILDHVRCGPPYLSAPRVSFSTNEACEKAMTNHGETLRLLITQPVCIDAAVEWMEERGRATADARILSDLAGAYYVRAQRDDRLSDVLRSLDAAQRAVAADPNLPAARFNLGLAQETLGFEAKARDTWERAGAVDRTKWAEEAAAHRTLIDRVAARNAALQWPLNRQRLPEAIAVGDRRTVRQLVQPFPAATQKYLEEELLPAWGAALAEGRDKDASQRLREASVIAAELEALTGDPYMREVVERITNARGEDLQRLRHGHVSYGIARGFDRAYDLGRAEAAFLDAAQAFAQARSPMRAGAELGGARLLQQKDEAKRKLAAIETETRERGYLNVWARTQSNRGNILQMEGQYLQAIALYDQAIAAFRGMHDDENVANVHARKAGIYHVLGQEEAALGEAFLGNRHAARMVEMPSRHLLAGETAATVLALEFKQIAFDYQTAFIETLENEAANLRGDAQTTNTVRVNRAIALRARAAIRLHLGDQGGAAREIDEAGAISGGQVSPKIRNALRARIAETRGEAALPSNPEAAIEAFTEALALAGPVRFRTFQAILLARRAEAYKLAGNAAAAERDLVDAIKELNAEEADLLAGRRRGQGEAIWADYFSRFQETYYRLIALLVAAGRNEEAFAYAEKSRAFEPLKLVLELPVADETVRSLDTSAVNPKALRAIRSSLPVGTFLLEYQVGDENTYVWVVSRDGFELRTLPVGRKSIREWSRTLQREAVTTDVNAFEKQLNAPYAALLSAPIEAVVKMKNGRMPGRRLVIVPDRNMHGLPFAALRNGRGRHLVEDFTISVAASATLYLHAVARDRDLAAAGGSPKALLVGNPSFDRLLDLTRGLEPLPFAEIEARNAGTLYAPHATVLVKEQATVPAFLAHSKDSTIIHVAGHAIVNRHAPFGTLLLMAPAKGHNGLLYTEELLTKLKLDRARLVVLAACSSAGGVPVGPEGLAPLVRPIVAAGVPGVVGSLWTIDDQRSQRVLGEFHQQYRNGHDAARALQLAQIRFLKEEKVAIPALGWAPFQVLGYASSPFPRSHYNEQEADQ